MLQNWRTDVFRHHNKELHCHKRCPFASQSFLQIHLLTRVSERAPDGVTNHDVLTVLGIPSFRQHSLSNSWIWWLCHWPYQAPSRREMDTQSQLLLLKKILDLTQSKQQKILRGYKWANIDLEDGRQSPAEWWTRLWSCWFTNASFIALNVWGSVCLTLQARWYLTGIDLCCIASSP